jgi:hypothetical protein
MDVLDVRGFATEAGAVIHDLEAELFARVI